MYKNSKLFFLLLMTCFCKSVYGQVNWQLAKQQDGIKVFLKSAEGNNIKMLRAECTVAAKPEAVLALLLDVPASEKWIPQTKKLRYLRRPSLTESFYYSQLSLPWPVSDRDYVVHLQASQQPDTKVITVDANVLKGEVPEIDGIVRVYRSIVKWVLYPAANGHTVLHYEIFTDPGGNIPGWVVNYFAKQAAIDIVKNLRRMVLQPPYNKAVSPFK